MMGGQLYLMFSPDVHTLFGTTVFWNRNQKQSLNTIPSLLFPISLLWQALKFWNSKSRFQNLNLGNIYIWGVIFIKGNIIANAISVMGIWFYREINDLQIAFQENLSCNKGRSVVRVKGLSFYHRSPESLYWFLKREGQSVGRRVSHCKPLT